VEVFPNGNDIDKRDKRQESEDVIATPAAPTEPVAKRLGLADLKRAAQERRERNSPHA
jgi:hypothetical protein